MQDLCRLELGSNMKDSNLRITHEVLFIDGTALPLERIVTCSFAFRRTSTNQQDKNLSVSIVAA